MNSVIVNRPRRRMRGLALPLLAAMALFARRSPRRRGRPTTSALGDSYAAGPLIPNQLLPLGCLKSDHNYAHLAAPSIGLTLRDAELQRREDRPT